MQALEAEEKEGLVFAIESFRDDHRTGEIGVRHHKNVGSPVRAPRGLRSRQAVEEEPVLHHARAAVEGREAMILVGAGLFHRADHAAGGVAVFGGRHGGEHLDLSDRILNRLGGFGAGVLVVSIHTVLEDADRAGALAAK
jgi:hypothetical protein